MSAPRLWPKEGSCRVPYWVYDDDAVHAREQERIFEAANWSYIGLEAEVPRPGDFRRTSVGARSVLLVRDKSGALSVLENRCSHRGVALCRQQAGHVSRFMCPYHQWVFDLRGNLCGVPFRKGLAGEGGLPPDFNVGDHSLRQLSVTVRNGVVFASFARDPEPLPAYLGSAITYFDRLFDGRALRVLGYMRQRIPCNWKLILENTKDPYHATLLHSFLVNFGLFRADQKSEVKMDQRGRHSALVSRHGGQALAAGAGEMASFRQGYTLEDRRLIEVLPEFKDGIGVVMQTIYPNLILQQQANSLATRRIVPKGPGETDLVWTFFGYADDDVDMTSRRLLQANMFGPSGLVSLDDGEVLKATQEGALDAPSANAIVEMGGRGEQDADTMVTEVALRAFYSHYIEQMGFEVAQ